MHNLRGYNLTDIIDEGEGQMSKRQFVKKRTATRASQKTFDATAALRTAIRQQNRLIAAR